jgi:Carboxypeptidase regulatory-like domain
MRKRVALLFALPLLVWMLLWTGAALASSTPPPMTKISVVVKTQGGHAIIGAGVKVHWSANKKHPAVRFGKAINTTFELRTNQEGTASIPAIPQGNILIQVMAKGYQTFGQTFDIDEDEKTVAVTLNPPQQQYTAH